ncbi:MAG: arylesterase [Caulobacter sp.]
MSQTAHRFPNRRRFLLGIGLLSQIAAAPKPVVITVLGDSITAGLGLPARDAMPAQLQSALGRRGISAVVRPAGVSGDTTGGGLARLGFSVSKDTQLCVVALGGNDLLQGVDPAQTKANLRGVLQKLKARNVRAVLVGVAAPARIGASYARDFNAIYPSLAKEFGVPLYANILAGVVGNPALMQRDGIHPNAQGAKKIGEALAAVIAKAVS